MPKILGNRILVNNTDEDLEQYQVSPALTVSTIYYKMFAYNGWLGAILMDMYLVLFPFVYLLILNKFAKNYVLYGICILNTMYVLNFFDNMFMFDTISLQLFIPLVMGILQKLRIKV